MANAVQKMPEARVRRRTAWAGEMFQQLVSERDDFQREVVTLKTEIAARDCENQSLRSYMADAERRISNAVMERDQAVADRAKWETLFVSVQAQLRAFEPPTAPLVKGGEETETDGERDNDG